MTSETDSECSSSSSEQEKTHTKFHKKIKKKSEKKHKKLKRKISHKEKKRDRKEEKIPSTVGDKFQSLKAQFVNTNDEKNFSTNNQADSFGPVLPPHLVNRNMETGKSQSLIIGPKMPEEVLENQEHYKTQNLSEKVVSEEEDYCLQSAYGPLPIFNKLEMTPAQIELEKRALELKMAAIDGISASTSNQNVREEWMLELPDVGLKGGLAALNNLKRGFHQGKEKPDFSDRSSWTKTPNSDQEKKKRGNSKEQMELHSQALFEKQRDAEQDLIAKKHKKKHKREESLVEIHQKKLRKEEKKKAKELKERGLKPERRPFTRDVDLKLNKIDRNQTKQIVDKAKILNTKFSSGHSKYL